MDGLVSDLRFFLRQVRRRPAWALSIVGVLTLGIGANTAMYAGLDAWVLRPLAFEEPERLVLVREWQERQGTRLDVSEATYTDLGERSEIFSALGAFDETHFNLSDTSEPVRVNGTRVTATLFPLLGIEPALGRGFRPEDDLPGQPGAVALIGHRLWRERYESSPAILGTTIRLDGRTHEIVGVMPEGFAFPSWSEVWAPIAVDPSVTRSRRTLEVVGRLDGAHGVESARAALAEVGREVALDHPDTNEGYSLRADPLRDFWLPSVVETALVTSMAAALFVLLIVCANVASLLLARATARGKEVALRTALGANRARLVRGAIVESVTLAVVSGLLGILTAQWWVDGMYAKAPVEPPYLFAMVINLRVALYTLGISIVAGLACALAPIVRDTGVRAVETLRSGGRHQGDGSSARLRGGLVLAEIALSTALAIGALLMVRSFLELRALDPGYRVDGVVIMDMSLSDPEFETPEERVRFLERLDGALANEPGLQAVGAVNILPSMGAYERTLQIEGQVLEAGEGARVAMTAYSGGYLDALSIEPTRGRVFTAEELRSGADAALVSESLARAIPDGELLGKRIRLLGPAEPGPWLRVVGVLPNVEGSRDMIPQEVPAHQVYRPYASEPSRRVTLAAVSARRPEEVASLVRDGVRTAGASVPVSEVLTMEDAIFRVQWLTEFFGRELATYGLIALFIAAVGLYGLVADAVSRRTHEIAIRLAIGARREDIVRAVVMKALGLGAAGTLAGLVVGVAGAQLGASILTGVRPTDPLVLGGVAALLAGTCLVASYLPARKAAALDPAEALRAE